MTKDVQRVIRVLGELADSLDLDDVENGFENTRAYSALRDAIQHLAYPDRDTYPKTRRGTKGAPIVRR